MSNNTQPTFPESDHVNIKPASISTLEQKGGTYPLLGGQLFLRIRETVSIKYKKGSKP